MQEFSENKSIRYSITTYFPQSHIQVCYMIGATGALIEEALLDGDGYYGRFLVEGEIDSFEKMSFIPDITLEILE